jgi:hypothetical protein
MHWSELPLTDQIFTHFEQSGSARIERTFAASALRRVCSQPGSELAGVAHVEVALEPGFLAILQTSRGLEEPRLLRALAARRYAPLLFCLLNDTHLLVDGTHTYAAMVLKGFSLARAYVVPECLWRSHLVEGLPSTTPEELLATPSYCGRARR